MKKTLLGLLLCGFLTIGMTQAAIFSPSEMGIEKIGKDKDKKKKKKKCKKTCTKEEMKECKNASNALSA